MGAVELSVLAREIPPPAELLPQVLLGASAAFLRAPATPAREEPGVTPPSLVASL
jgi:hypothetical protein